MNLLMRLNYVVSNNNMNNYVVSNNNMNNNIIIEIIKGLSFILQCMDNIPICYLHQKKEVILHGWPLLSHYILNSGWSLITQQILLFCKVTHKFTT